MIKRDTSDGAERCVMCDRISPPSSTVLRKVENNRVLCILCLVEIAEIAQSERT
jgi:hypothetical protein